MKNIDLEVKDFLKKRGMTKGYFLNELGMSAMGYKQMIDNKTIKVSTLEKIAEIFNLPTSYFFEDSKENLTAEIVKAVRKKPKVVLQIELDSEQENNVLKMVLGKDFINLIK